MPTMRTSRFLIRFGLPRWCHAAQNDDKMCVLKDDDRCCNLLAQLRTNGRPYAAPEPSSVLLGVAEAATFIEDPRGFGRDKRAIPKGKRQKPKGKRTDRKLEGCASRSSSTFF